MYYPSANSIEKRIESWKLVVPLFDNEGKRFNKEVIDKIRVEIIREFGGFSAVNTVGYWQLGEQLFSDISTTVIVDIPSKDHNKASAFFTDLKKELQKELRQEKIYVTYEKAASELLSVNEFLQELGFEIPSTQLQPLTQEEIDKMVGQAARLQLRENYRTLRLERDAKKGMIVWEREVLGVSISTEIKDEFPNNAVILAADNLESYFKKDNFGKPLVVIGDYEYQSFVLDKEKRKYILHPDSFAQYDKGDEESHFYHEWHGVLKTSKFIPIYIEELLTNYIILRELRPKKRIKIIVGSDGSIQSVDRFVLHCPAYIPDQEVQKAILDGFIVAKNKYENQKIDKIALMQIKVLNKYNEKKALIKGSKNLKEWGATQ